MAFKKLWWRFQWTGGLVGVKMGGENRNRAISGKEKETRGGEQREERQKGKQVWRGGMSEQERFIRKQKKKSKLEKENNEGGKG